MGKRTLSLVSSMSYQRNPAYRGCYRYADLYSYCGRPGLDDLLEWYLDEAGQLSGIAMKEGSLSRTIELYRRLKKIGWHGELMVTGEPPMPGEESLRFLGYDVCGECEYYSPLRDMMSFESISPDIHHMLCCHGLNKNGLLDDRADAQMIADFCNANYGVVETERDWHPLPVYTYELSDCSSEE